MTHCRQIMLEELQRRNFAPTTISTYLHAVEQFARHFRCRPDRLNQTHFRSYQAYLLRERRMRPLTVRLHVAALRVFFVKTLKRRYLLDDTPYPKAPRRLPQILSVEEMARVIDAADSLSHRTMLDGLVLVTGALPDNMTSERRTAAVDDLLRSLRVAAGVRQVAAVYRAPLQGPIGLDGQLLIEGDPVVRESYTRHPAINDESVTPGYFAVMGIRIIAGREFTDRDTADRPPVVVVSESLARQLWPGQDPIGRRLFAGVRLALMPFGNSAS